MSPGDGRGTDPQAPNHVPPCLQDLPNIGKETARLLVQAGIQTPRDLQQLGAVGAALRIAGLRPEDPPCRSMLAGLEGAIRGVRWRVLPKAERERLWEEYQLRWRR